MPSGRRLDDDEPAGAAAPPHPEAPRGGGRTGAPGRRYRGPAALASRAGAWAGSRPWTVPLLCAGGLLLIVLLDLAQAAGSWSVPVTALLDEPAHLATAALLLAAFLPRRAVALVPWALAGAVLIDLDHVPLYLWGAGTADGYGRPVTHSLLTVVVLTGAAVVARRRVRSALLGLAVGVLLHLVRDLGTGPGVPLWWPVWPHSVLLPYGVYLGAVVVVAAVAVLRRRRARPVVRTGSSARP